MFSIFLVDKWQFERTFQDLLWNKDPNATEKLLLLAQNLKKDSSKDTGDVEKWREGPVEKRLEYAIVKVCSS